MMMAFASVKAALVVGAIDTKLSDSSMKARLPASDLRQFLQNVRMWIIVVLARRCVCQRFIW